MSDILSILTIFSYIYNPVYVETMADRSKRAKGGLPNQGHT